MMSSTPRRDSLSYTHTHTHTHTQTHVNTQTHTDTHVYVRVCVFTCVHLPTPAELLCERLGTSMAEAAANMDRGSVPSNMELRGSGATEEEEEEDEEVLPLRVPRRDLASVTLMERNGVVMVMHEVKPGMCNTMNS